jgi:hypothetical protein
MLVAMASRAVHHRQKALEQMHLKLTEVVSDITGTTGMTIIRAILAGECAPQRLAPSRDKRCKHDHATIAKALEGTGAPRIALHGSRRWTRMICLRSSCKRAMDTLQGVSRRLCRTWRPPRPRLRLRAHGAQAGVPL